MSRYKVEISGINTAQLKVLTNAEMKELFVKLQQGDESAKETLINGNLKLVLSIVQRFSNRCENMDDLFQVGCIGLVKSIDNFDLKHEVRFSTYAVPVILGEMRRLFRDGGTVKVSRSLKELGMKLNRCREQFAREHGREATITELAQQLQVTQEAVVEALGANSPPVSLTSSEDSSEVDLPVSSPEELLSDILSLRQMLERLEERDQKLIQFRYFQNMTQVQTAQRLEMTQVQVSRREKKICKKSEQK